MHHIYEDPCAIPYIWYRSIMQKEKYMLKERKEMKRRER